MSKYKDWLYYDLPAELVPNFWSGKYLGQRQIWFKLKFLGDDSDIDIDGDEPEFKSWAWKDKQFLLDNCVEFKKEIYKKVLKEL